ALGGWSRGDHDSHPVVLAGKERGSITARGATFLLSIAPAGPHPPTSPPVRHAEAFAGATAPRTPSFDQEDVSREPAWLRELPRLGQAGVERADELYRARMRSMLGVDDLVGAVVDALGEAGRLRDTYLFFTSDNGFHLGTHRLRQGKTTP